MTGTIVDQLNDPARISPLSLPSPLPSLLFPFRSLSETRNRCCDAARMRRLWRFGKSMHPDDKIILENYPSPPRCAGDDDETGIELGNS